MPKSQRTLQRTYGFSHRVSEHPEALNSVLTYAIWDGSLAIKIGKTDRHPVCRLENLQTGNVQALRLLAYTHEPDEKTAHKRLRKWRLRGEWFSPSAEVLEEISHWDWVDTGLYHELLNRVETGEEVD